MLGSGSMRLLLGPLWAQYPPPPIQAGPQETGSVGDEGGARAAGREQSSLIRHGNVGHRPVRVAGPVTGPPQSLWLWGWGMVMGRAAARPFSPQVARKQ